MKSSSVPYDLCSEVRSPASLTDNAGMHRYHRSPVSRYFVLHTLLVHCCVWDWKCLSACERKTVNWTWANRNEETHWWVS